MSQPPEISIVTTLYRSAAYVDEFYRRMSAAVQKITQSYEIIFVNDGSPDNSLEVVLKVREQDSKVTIIDLSRNFGHHKAIMTGLEHASGKKVFLIDVDLEEAPELINEFYEELQKDADFSVVYGVQETRKGGLLERLGGKVFYAVFNFMSAIRIPENFVMARLMTQDYVRTLIQYRDREIFLGGLFQLAGYKQKPLSVKKLCNATTTYSFSKRVLLFINAITSFTSFPLVLISVFGMLITFVSALFSIFILIQKLIGTYTADGWTSLILSIWFLGGLITFSVGIVGIYIAKIFSEVKERPYTTVKAIWGGNK